MAAATQTIPELESRPRALTLEEYLRTSYRPDCDFVDGYLEERNMGGMKHSMLQTELAFWFRAHSAEWNVRPLTELRTRVATTRVRLPDVSVVRIDHALAEEVRETPPLIAIEVLSPDDRLNLVVVRLRDFRRMGIEHVWLIDPAERVAFTYADGLKLVEEDRLTVPGTPIYLDLPQLFQALNFPA